MAVTASIFDRFGVLSDLRKNAERRFCRGAGRIAQVAPDSVGTFRAGKKKNRGRPLFLIEPSQASRPIPSGPSGGIPSPSVERTAIGAGALRYAFLPEHSSGFPPSLPSAVGRSSVPVGIGNITKPQKDVSLF